MASVYAGVVEWQTRYTQNVVLLERKGSTPFSGIDKQWECMHIPRMYNPLGEYRKKGRLSVLTESHET